MATLSSLFTPGISPQQQENLVKNYAHECLVDLRSKRNDMAWQSELKYNDFEYKANTIENDSLKKELLEVFKNHFFPFVEKEWMVVQAEKLHRISTMADPAQERALFEWSREHFAGAKRFGEKRNFISPLFYASHLSELVKQEYYRQCARAMSNRLYEILFRYGRDPASATCEDYNFVRERTKEKFIYRVDEATKQVSILPDDPGMEQYFQKIDKHVFFEFTDQILALPEKKFKAMMREYSQNSSIQLSYLGQF